MRYLVLYRLAGLMPRASVAAAKAAKVRLPRRWIRAGEGTRFLGRRRRLAFKQRPSVFFETGDGAAGTVITNAINERDFIMQM
jgi:hypothetical protein